MTSYHDFHTMPSGFTHKCQLHVLLCVGVGAGATLIVTLQKAGPQSVFLLDDCETFDSTDPFDRAHLQSVSGVLVLGPMAYLTALTISSKLGSL